MSGKTVKITIIIQLLMNDFALYFQVRFRYYFRWFQIFLTPQLYRKNSDPKLGENG